MKKKRFWAFKPFYILELVAFAALLLVSFFHNSTLFFILIPLVLLVAGYTTYKFFSLQKDIHKFLSGLGEHLDAGNLKGLFDLPMPVVVVSANREIVWYNKPFQEIVAEEDMYGANFSRITYTPLEELRQGQMITYRDKNYQIYIVQSQQNAAEFYMVYFFEITQLQNTFDKYHLTKPVIMMILIDSYDEIVKNIRESERAQIISEINRLLEKHLGTISGCVERLGNDRYFAIIEKQHFDKMIEQKFPILDESKNIINSERVPVTLSIGAAYEEDTLEKNEQYARQALEMALGRGGDQVAVKIQDGFQFYGGVSKGIEKRTKVKSRILASAMRELIENSDNVMIMGHRFADLDAIGSAIGLASACMGCNKPVNIVVDENRCLANCMIEYYAQFEDRSLFIAPADALEMMRRNTLLFVVDTHSPHMVESEDIYRSARNVVVIDHHRKMVDYIDNAVIFFHEPYTSSTSEMVTEVLQYFGDDCVMNHYHAEALLAGIMLDTKDFVMKTGVRTFEAAAYLKRKGADTIIVKKMFAGTIESYKDKTRLVASAQIYKRCAIVCSTSEVNDIRIVAPQAADELLNIQGVDASFVLFEQNDAININARSMGALNVQVIMEMLGGGGHQTMAGVQVPRAKMDGVKALLLKSIDEYFTD